MLTHLAVVLMVAAQVVRPAVAPGNELKQIALAYHNYHDTTNKGPGKLEDLVPFLDGEKKLIDGLKDGTYVFIYGVGIRDMKEGTSKTVLAYHKDVPTRGGYVAYGDGSVKRLTAEEFKQAILAKKP